MHSFNRLLVLLTCWYAVAQQPYPIATGRNMSGAYLFQLNFQYQLKFQLLPEDDVYSPYLQQGVTQWYFFLIGDQNSSSLTIMITPCSSTLDWRVYYKNENQTGKVDYSILTGATEVSSYLGKQTHVFNKSNANKGLYIVQVTAVERNSYIKIYASRYNGLLISLRLQERPKVRLQRRKHKNKGTIRWEQSVINTKHMHYCVVINTRQEYGSLCEAYSDKKIYPPQSVYDDLEAGPSSRVMETETLDDQQGSLQTYDDITIGCVGKKLSFTVDHMEHGKVYYINIFAIDKKRKLSLPYGNMTVRYDKKLHHLGLRDNKPVTVNLRKLDGRASFHYKVSQKTTMLNTLEWHITPCGGAVDVEIRQNCSVVIPKLRVEGYKRIQVLSTKPGQRFVLKLSVSKSEELHSISGVEVLATMKGTSIPLLPDELSVNEFTSLRRCNSVTVGWIPATDGQGEPMRYCVSATLVTSNRRNEIDLRPRFNQCNLERRLKEATDFSVRHCQDISANDYQNVIVQEIYRLKPGSEYLVQVTVKKAKGKTLSYDLLRVYTKPKCS